MSSERVIPGLAARATTVAAARSLGAELYYPHELTPLARPERFHFTAVAARLGAVTAGLLSYSSSVRIDTEPYLTSFQMNVPLRGQLRTSVGGRRVDATRARAAVYGPDVPTAISGWEQPCVMLAVKMDRALVEARVAAERGPGSAERFAPELDVHAGAGAAWIASVRTLIATVQRVPDLDEGLAEHLAGRCIDGFVLAALGREPEPRAPAADAAIVDRVREAIVYTRGPALTLGAMADYAGVCGRSVQLAFREVLGTTPMRVQREERLQRVRAELNAGDPRRDTVAGVARRHGFLHLGRFSGLYRERFGEAPSCTLAGSGRAGATAHG
ncbi:AraC family transcriptional regulator [Leucobacter allii]|uniref:AraC family transcriptional regulator n=1 Tax=Leucobacter allii TaxID=2932247 RepID=UPI001FD2B3DA|nr:AraC family transcriptional regulator [Leucobacter allii]UOR01118.1 AraC family transcriptional regulator [Leucobacter allii]